MTRRAREELPVPELTADEANELADDILSRVEFRRPAPSIFDRIGDEISELLGRLFESLVGSGAGTAFAWLVLGVAVVFVIVLASRFSRSVSADRAAPDEPEMVELSRSPSEWRAEADRLEADGSFKDALLARYRALVGELVRDGVVDEIPGRTTGEYRVEVAEHLPDRAAAFDEATMLFERAWYGDEPTGASERDRFVALDRSVTGARR